jgi:hypothetical protein
MISPAQGRLKLLLEWAARSHNAAASRHGILADTGATRVFKRRLVTEPCASGDGGDNRADHQRGE